MERILPAKVHNKFELILTDAKTGAVKQSVTCYNIVLNSFFNRLVNRQSKLGYILLGTGTGTPVVTRTSLFTHQPDQCPGQAHQPISFHPHAGDQTGTVCGAGR